MKKEHIECLSAISVFLESAEVKIQTILEEEQNHFDNLSERTQESERGEFLQERIENLINAISLIDELVSEIDSSIEEY